MKEFDLYEFTSIFVPGVILIVGTLPLLPQSCVTLLIDKGALSIFYLLVIGFAIGHLVQAVGNIVEWFFWIPFRGRPTDWLRLRKQKYFSAVWRSKIFDYYQLDSHTEPHAKEWEGYVRLTIEKVTNSSGGPHRLLVFNSNYGMFRGMAAAFLLVMTAHWVYLKLTLIEGIILLGLTCLSLYRMYRFAGRYATILLATFINEIDHK